MNAKTFLAEIKKLNFSGRDFLEIIGNSKISNSVYNEIKENPKLTYSQLVNLLENSSLASDDYTRILKDAYAKHRGTSGKAVQGATRAENPQAAQSANSQRAAQLLAEAKRQVKEQLLAEARERDIKIPEEALRRAQTRQITESPAIHGDETRPENSEKADAAEKLTQDTQDDIDDNGAFEIDGEFYEETEDYDGPDISEISYDYVSFSTETNKSKLALCLCMAVILAGLSFLIRYFQTGSFLIEKKDEQVGFSVPATYEELAERLVNAGDVKPETLSFGGNYRLDENNAKSKKDVPSKTLLYNDRYIFYVNGNRLHAIEIKNGAMSEIAAIEYDAETTREIYMIDNMLYVIFEGEYRGKYFHASDASETGETGGIPTEYEPISGEFTQKTVTVRVYDAREFIKTPAFEFTVDGEYNSVLYYKGHLSLITYYTPHEPKAVSDLSAFVPSFIINGRKQFSGINNIYAPPAELMNTGMTVISVINGDNPEVTVCAGGAGSVYSDDNAFFVSQSAAASGGGMSRLLKVYTGGTGEPSYCDINGVIPVGAVDFKGGSVRVGSYDGGKSALYIFDGDLNLVSRVINIGNGKPESILFDEGRVYFILDKLYVFDTTVPEDVITAEEPFANIYADDFYRVSDKERLEVMVETDGDGKRSGIRLNIHKTEYGTLRDETHGETQADSTYLITAESGIEGNWNPYIYTDAETVRDSVFISGEEGVIIIPVKYFNGISNIEKIIVFDYSEYTGLAKRNEIVYYDINADSRRAVLIDGVIYSFWDDMAVSAGAADATVIGTLVLG